MNIQRLRNITTGRLHTQMSHIYEDVEIITGAKGVMTHMLGNAADAMRPYLKAVAPDRRLWDGVYDVTHMGEIAIPPMDADAQAAFWERYRPLPNPLAGKQVMVLNAADGSDANVATIKAAIDALQEVRMGIHERFRTDPLSDREIFLDQQETPAEEIARRRKQVAAVRALLARRDARMTRYGRTAVPVYVAPVGRSISPWLVAMVGVLVILALVFLTEPVPMPLVTFGD